MSLLSYDREYVFPLETEIIKMTTLAKDILTKISTKIYKRFPDFQGIKPTVKKRPKDKSTKEIPPGYLLVYKNEVTGPGGQKITRLVRVVTTEEGKIGKISTSK